MHVLPAGSFPILMHAAEGKFLAAASKVDVGRWQSIDVSDRPEMVTHELLNVSFDIMLPNNMEGLQQTVKPNLPWAEDHFQERVSGQPWNPPPSEAWWPYNVQNKIFKKNEKFDHTYPERFWPKRARITEGDRSDYREESMRGIRFDYGDLDDVVKQLHDDRLTRQAYLPVWFPEDTGAVKGQRVPCTLGYHFIVRNRALNCVYYIRSCDFMRHFRDDVYMAWRLTQWIAQGIDDNVGTGRLVMHITSFHIFDGDLPMLRQQHGQT